MREKKSWKSLMALVLGVAMLLPSQAAYATEGQAEGKGVEAYEESRGADADGFEIENGVLKKYTGTATEVVIPEGVTSIGDYAFIGCSSLTEVVIPERVTSIGDYAFADCSSLSGMTLPKGLISIGYEAFCGCSGLEYIKVEEGNAVFDSRGNCNAVIETESNMLIRGCKNTIIPEDVTGIGKQAFCRCTSLTGIVIPEGVTGIGSGAFYECTNLEEINIPEGVAVLEANTFNGCESLKKIALPEGVKSIQGFSFQRCFSLEEINIPASVEEIGPAFDACRSLSNITIPRGVASIASGAFSGCSSLEYIKVEEGNAVYDSRENCNAIIEKESGILLAGGKNTVIPEGVTSIGRSAFLGSGLSKISIPKGVTMIERDAFQYCSSLTEISISESVAEIQSAAFQGCSSLMEIAVPESVTIIGRNAFAGCNEELVIFGKKGSYAETYANENNIKFSSTGMALPPIGKKTISSNNVSLSQNSYTYDGKAKKPTVTVKDGSKTLVQNTDYIVSYSKNINAGTAKVKITGKGNYEGTVTKNFTITVKKGTSHKVGSYQYKVTGTSTVSVTGIKNNKATKVKIPKTVKIGGKDFKVTAIGSKAFKDNKKITSIEIGDNVRAIGVSAFEGCTKLSKATLGKGISEISGNAFKSCKKLGTITIQSTKLKKVGRNALKGIKPTAKIKVPAKKLPAYKKLFKNKGQGRKVKIVK